MKQKLILLLAAVCYFILLPLPIVLLTSLNPLEAFAITSFAFTLWSLINMDLDTNDKSEITVTKLTDENENFEEFKLLLDKLTEQQKERGDKNEI